MAIKKDKHPLPNSACDWLVLDISNLLYRTFFADRGNNDNITIAGMATHSGLMSMNKYFKQFKPKKGVVMAFDRSSWRKEYTASNQCLSGKAYKGNRRKNMSPAQQAMFEQFINHVREFEQLIIDHTTIISLVNDKLEADDVISGFCQIYEGDNIIIISADSDLLQLTKYDGVKVISPATDKEQSLKDFDNDPIYYVFQKCMRGDPTDNIASAYPRLRSTRIKKAYTDSFERVQLMKETWVDEKGRTLLVEDMFNENQLLIDLEKQPIDIRRTILSTVDAAMDRKRKFSMFHLMKFCHKYELKKIMETIDQFIPMMSK